MSTKGFEDWKKKYLPEQYKKEQLQKQWEKIIRRTE
jgi:predicted HAD superfamily Cof-like phosphohydrolase